MPDLIAELMELPDFTQDAIDNSVDVAAFKGIKIDSFTKLPLKVRVSHYNDWLNELFKSKGGFVNGYQSEGTVKKELGISFDVGKDKEIGFMLNPEEKKAQLGFKMMATKGTANAIRKAGMEVKSVLKVKEGRPHIVDHLTNKEIDLVINTTFGKQAIIDSYSLRRTSLTRGIPYCTTIAGAFAAISAIQTLQQQSLDVYPIQEYF